MDKYVYDGTRILKNKLGIKSQEELSLFEHKITMPRIILLRERKSKFTRTFDFNHLKNIHHYLFSDIYDWAGKIRDVDIAKGNSLFCKAVYIERYAEDIFREIKKKNYFKETSKEELSLKLAEVLLDLNALHPFREGNGRTQREFIRELAEERGYNLSFEHFSIKENIKLSDLALNPEILADKLNEGMKKI